ncbi:DUF2569 domain-containing protein [Psychrobium sp. MM17-31]|uniref:DUF2569 domain-containing protein n=1 Tax=Psychrobium sp. MM17-31 TaxID=2917758 RepID=UPI001EF43DBB|nr:DUF2569 domain-containing protein [Psychrobium sp. MM17-31]MCG7530739.1 DUF2569 domain-containing protein [Psychrobium sp. MM17-31]
MDLILESQQHSSQTIPAQVTSLQPENEATALPIGGWLILVAIGVVIAPFRVSFEMASLFIPIFTDGTWDMFVEPTSEHYAPLLAAFIASEIVINLLIISCSFYLMVLFFKKKRYFPHWYFGLALASTGFILFDAAIAKIVFFPEIEMFDIDTIRALARSGFALLIWTPYLFVSQRAKDTFIN